MAVNFFSDLLPRQDCFDSKEISYGISQLKGGRMDGYDSSTPTRTEKSMWPDAYSEKKSLLHELGEDDVGSGPNCRSDGISAHKKPESGVVRRSLKVRLKKQPGSSESFPLLLVEQDNDKRSTQSGQKTKTAQGASGRESPSSTTPMFRAIPSANSGASATSATAPPKSADRQHHHQNALQRKTPDDRMKELRALMCGNQDAAGIDRCIKSVFEARLDADNTAGVLRAMTTPTVENINDHVNEVYFNTAANLYKQYSDKDLSGKLERAAQKYAKSKKYYRVRQHLLNVIYKKLTLEDRKTLKETSFEAYDAAVKNDLSTLHAAIRSGNATAVDAYIRAVLKYAPRDQMVRLLEMKDKYGRSALHTAMLSGSPEVIETYMKAIIKSSLPHKTKLDIFFADRADGAGAFYLAMGAGDKERAEAFIKVVLGWGVTSDVQANLLHCFHDKPDSLKSTANLRLLKLSRSRSFFFPRKITIPYSARGLAIFTKKQEAVAMYDNLVKNAPTLDRDAKIWLRSRD
jgi:hypothetical protein